MVWFRSDFSLRSLNFSLALVCESSHTPSIKLFSNKKGKKDDEFFTNAFSLCTQMAIWFSYFDLLMWWFILIDFIILNYPRRNPFCSCCFILLYPRHWPILLGFVSISIRESALQCYSEYGLLSFFVMGVMLIDWILNWRAFISFSVIWSKKDKYLYYFSPFIYFFILNKILMESSRRINPFW